MSTKWTPELTQEVVARYTETMKNDFTTDVEREANTTQVIENIVAELKKGEMPGATVNGVRILLVKAGVYIKKSGQAPAKAAGGAEGGSKRVSKADAHQELINLINTIDASLVDAEIIGKLTGKAAQYVTSILAKVL